MKYSSIIEKAYRYVRISLLIVCILIGSCKDAYVENFIPNSSFEITTVEDIPDCWDQYGGPQVVSGWYELWRIDPQQAYHGSKSLLLQITDKSQIGKVLLKPSWSRKTVRAMNWSQPKPGNHYTFSVFMKSDRVRFPVFITYPRKETVYVGREWQRFVVSAQAENEIGILSIAPAGVGKLWIDALQVEQGMQATNYKTAQQDGNLFRENISSERKALSSFVASMFDARRPFQIRTDLSYYTKEQHGHVALDLFAPIASTANQRLSVVVTPEGEKKSMVLFSGRLQAIMQKKDIISIPVAAFHLGRHKISASVYDKQGRKIYTAQTDFIKLAPARHEVKIDHTSRTLLVNGNKFFFFGAAYLRATLNKERIPEILKQLREHGYTVVIPTFTSKSSDYHSANDEIVAFFNLAQQNGLMVVPWIDLPAAKTTSGEFVMLRKHADSQTLYGQYIAELERMIPLLKNHPALLAWYLFDEPNAPDWLKSGYNRKLVDHARRLDPYHPHYINYGALKDDLSINNGTIAGDMVSLTQYPIPLRAVMDVAEKTSLEFQASENKKPVCLWLQFYAGNGRYPTPAELTCMTYLSAIYGATCFKTWPLMPGSKMLWDATRTLIQEMKTLAPVLMSADAKLNLQTESENIHFVVKKKEDAYYIIAVNASPTREKVKFKMTLPFMQAGGKLRVLFEDRRIPFDENGFTDAFNGFSRRVYVIE